MTGLLDTVRPILGYVIAIAIILILATLGFMAVVSSAIVSSATTMAEILVLIALHRKKIYSYSGGMVGIAAASRAAEGM